MSNRIPTRALLWSRAWLGPMTPKIELCEVSMAYTAPTPWCRALARRGAGQHEVLALHRINLRVTPPQRIAVFGENGAGKTTLLKVIAGMLLPTHGRVLIDGLDISAPAALKAARIGHAIGDERAFYWRLSGFENLRFFAALEDLFAPLADKRIRELLDAVGLQTSAHRGVAEYSSGMRQRLAIARGLLTDPKILLLDEPTRSLDPAATEAILSLLAGPLAKGRSLVVATNRFEDAMVLCDTVFILRAGRIVGSRNFENSPTCEQLANFVRGHLRTGTSPAT